MGKQKENGVPKFLDEAWTDKADGKVYSAALLICINSEDPKADCVFWLNKHLSYYDAMKLMSDVAEKMMYSSKRKEGFDKAHIQ